MTTGSLLARYAGEIATKAPRTRRRFQRTVRRNLRDALASTGRAARIAVAGCRLVVSDGGPAALHVAARVFGLASISAVEAECPADLASIVRTGLACNRSRVAGRTFAVRARRRPRGDPSSQAINEALGAALAVHGRVCLDDPDVTIHVDVQGDRAFLFGSKIPAGAGLPIGVEGRGIALLSGGFDSAVAAWMLLKRGMALDYVFCNLAGPAHERSVVAVAKLLADGWSFGSRPLLHVVDLEPLAQRLSRTVTPALRQVVLKRLMYRAARDVARERDALAIVTGESLGQVSSQTASNLRTIEACVDRPVLRPLIGADKQEIVARSRAIGTYALSEKVREHCALVERRPATSARPDEVEREEQALGLGGLDVAIRSRRVLELRSLERDDLVTRYLYVDEVPDGATVLDVRSGAQFRSWHYPGAVQVDAAGIEDGIDRLDPAPTYVLCCERGAVTAAIAERMQRAGLAAYSFRGGVAALRRYAGRREPSRP
jgi:thiamine biosynthesis protein ThiI